MTIVRISRNTRILSSYVAYADVVDTAAGATNFINDGTARTIASWWQSPGRIGHVLASLASGVPVELDDLLADIDATIDTDRVWENEYDEEALNQLREWAIDAGYTEDDDNV